MDAKVKIYKELVGGEQRDMMRQEKSERSSRVESQEENGDC